MINAKIVEWEEAIISEKVSYDTWTEGDSTNLGVRPLSAGSFRTREADQKAAKRQIYLPLKVG